jgi:hypothetical protein
MSDILSLLTTCLSAATEPEPRERRGRKGAFGGTLWSVNVPVAQSTIQRILKYATDKERFVYEGNWASLIGLRATDAGLIATISSEVRGHKLTASLAVDYANADERTLCTGGWLKLQYGEVRLFPTQLLPTITATSFGAIISLRAAVRRRRTFLTRWIMGEYQEFELRGFRLTPTDGQLLTGSEWFDVVTPRFVWAALPVEVDSK